VTVTVDLHGLTGDEARGLVASMVAHYRGLGQVRSLSPLPPSSRLPGPLASREKDRSAHVLTSARSASPLRLTLLGLGQGSRGRVVLRLIVGKVRLNPAAPSLSPYLTAPSAVTPIHPPPPPVCTVRVSGRATTPPAGVRCWGRCFASIATRRAGTTPRYAIPSTAHPTPTYLHHAPWPDDPTRCRCPDHVMTSCVSGNAWVQHEGEMRVVVPS